MVSNAETLEKLIASMFFKGIALGLVSFPDIPFCKVYLMKMLHLKHA
jgi:hypothetical protein